MKEIYILAIETSCDETSVAVVKNGRQVISNVISSQIKIHEIYGGVVPEIASRKHIEQIDIVLEEAINAAQMTLNDIDAIAVTCGPGLVGALLVGVSYAKGLAFSLNKPLIAVHHIEGHIHANFLENPSFEPPFICLVVSGGHTALVNVADYTHFEVLGATYDDAAGEAFDKVARALKLGYPGGPAIDKVSKDGDPDKIHFPRAYLSDTSLDFSFSGLKSAVLNYMNQQGMQGVPLNVPDICASFQKAVVEVLVNKTIKAAEGLGVKKIALAGGVCCNSYLRNEIFTKTEGKFTLNIPQPVFCTDNAAMIGARGYHDYIKNNFSGLDLNAYPTLRMK